MLNFDRLLDLVTTLVWIVVLIGIAVAFIRTFRRYGPKTAVVRLFSARILFPFALAVGITILSTALVFIEPHQVGVVVSIVSPKGYRDRPMNSGLHWIVPFAENVIRYPIYWQTYTMSSKPMEGQEIGDDSIVARTSDGQEVALDASIIFRIDPEQVVRIHIDWRELYIQKLVRPVTRGIIRTEVSQFKVDEINSFKRLDLELILDKQLQAELEDKGFIFDQFLLRNIAFSNEYATAVERKQVAFQDVTQKEHQAQQIRNLAQGTAAEIRIKAQAEAEARIIRAQAEAQALRLIADALAQNGNLLTYQYINKLSPAIRTMLVPGNTPYILPLPTMVPVETSASAPATPAATSPITSTIPLPDIPLESLDPLPTPLLVTTPTPGP